jgi:hypothetical protein
MFPWRSLLVLCALVGALLLAVPRTSSGAGSEERYVVQPGDTLWELAASHYGGDPREGVWRIRDRNAIAGTGLQPGTILYLPVRAGGA